MGDRASSRSDQSKGIPGKRSFLLLGGVAFGDPVEEWKRSVRTRVVEEERARIHRPAFGLRVEAGFVLIAALVAAAARPFGSATVLALFASALVAQELPRALFVRALGRSTRIRLSAFGSDTHFSGAPLQRLPLVAFTSLGSIVNLMVAAAAFWIAKRELAGEVASFAYLMALCHAVWGTLSLLPVFPFRVGKAISARLSPPRRLAHIGASMMCVIWGGFAVGLAKAPVLLGPVFLVGYASAVALKEAYRESCDSHAGINIIASQAESDLSKDEPRHAAELARRGLRLAMSAGQRERLWRALAWAGIGQKDPVLAHGSLLRLQPEAIDLHLLASYLNACNRGDEAVEILWDARSHGHRSPEATKLLLDLLFRRGEHEAVHALARTDKALLSPNERRAIAVALEISTTES